METQTHTPAISSSSNQFQSGSVVIYGMHGKCSVVAVESRKINGESIPFYKLEVQKSALSRSTRQEPAIWVPVASARERGLRAPMTKEDAEAALAVLANREYYFSANEPWSAMQHKLEACIRHEGAIGLAKVVSYLYVLKRRQIVTSPEITRMHEAINKLMLRELSEALGEHPRILEERINKSMRRKLTPDQ